MEEFTKNIATRDQHHLLWKFYLYYFLMMNKQLKKNQKNENCLGIMEI